MVLLPAYNEAASIVALLIRIQKSLHGMDFHIVVVDDGSSDGTDKLVESESKNIPITLLKHTANQGLGRGMNTGLGYVCSHWAETDMLVTMDADNTHDPNLIQTMLHEIDNGADIVIASRFVGNAGQVGVPAHRRILSTGAKFLLKWIFPLGANDYTCGYRLYRISLLNRAMKLYNPFIEANGFVVMVEILLKLSRLGPRVVEVPLVLRYDLKESPTKLKLVKTLMEYGKILLLFWLKRAKTTS